MRTMPNTTKPLAILAYAAAFFSLMSALAPQASAAIIYVKDVQSCNSVGLDGSAATAKGGVHCDTGNAAFSLTSVLNGDIALYVGNSATPSWNLINDTGSTLTSLTLYFSGSLASNASIDMQVSGTKIFGACTSTPFGGSSNFDAKCGTDDITIDDPALPLKMVWSEGAKGTGVANGETFNLGTASFAHAGADAGCISGTPTCSNSNVNINSSVPEPSTFLLLGTSLLGVAWFTRKRAALAAAKV